MTFVLEGLVYEGAGEPQPYEGALKAGEGEGVAGGEKFLSYEYSFGVKRFPVRVKLRLRS